MTGKLRDIRTGVEVLGVVSQRLDELSKILRRGSSIQSQRTPDVSLNEIVQETIILLDARLQSVELSLVLGDIPKLEAQRSHLSVVISNLLSNAVDALDEQKNHLDGYALSRESVVRLDGIGSMFASKITVPVFRLSFARRYSKSSSLQSHGMQVPVSALPFVATSYESTVET